LFFAFPGAIPVTLTLLPDTDREDQWSTQGKDIAERVKAGLRRAKENGKKLGRPKARLDVEKLRELKERGLSLRQIAKHCRVSRTTVHELLKTVGTP